MRITSVRAAASVGAFLIDVRERGKKERKEGHEREKPSSLFFLSDVEEKFLSNGAIFSRDREERGTLNQRNHNACFSVYVGNAPAKCEEDLSAEVG